MTLLGITGSTGHIGGRVARRLASDGERLRLVVRDPTRAPNLPGAEVVVAEYGDAAAARTALKGVDVVLMVSASESPERRQQHRTFIAAAASAGVGHLIYTSFVGASPKAVFTLGRDHGDAEQAIKESGLVHTFLRDNFYADLLPYFADEDGVIRGPAGNGTVAAVARADVADAAAAVLREPTAHRGAVYHLTGPEAITLDALASRASAVLGRDLRFVNETIEEAYASRAKFTSEQWLLDAWVSTYTAIADGEVDEVTDDVRALTGHVARRLEQALRGD
jgi:NAD(P)H dehydrogenase (quinone)